MDPIYLDHAATTPLREEAREALVETLASVPGNPSSPHRWGREAKMKLEEARERLAAVLGAQRREVVFTAGGTVADNLAILGRWRAAGSHGGPGAVVVSAVEHQAVLSAARAAGREGAELIILGVDGEGRLLLESLDEGLAARPSIVSVMWGNNEVGTLQPVSEVAERCREAGVVFHTDAVQALGKVEVRVDRVGCDLLAVSAHKVGGPKGVGALYVREGVELHPLTFGGGQERGYHPGTEDVAGAVAFAVAAELAERERESEALRLERLRDRLQAALVAGLPDLIVNGRGAPRLFHILNVSVPVPGVDVDMLVPALDLEGLAVSSGSACQSGTVEPSHVLVAMGRDPRRDGAPIRLSLGRTTTERDVEQAAERFIRVVARVRELAGP